MNDRDCKQDCRLCMMLTEHAMQDGYDPSALVTGYVKDDVMLQCLKIGWLLVQQTLTTLPHAFLMIQFFFAFPLRGS